jgi:hypothetical protein
MACFGIRNIFKKMFFLHFYIMNPYHFKIILSFKFTNNFFNDIGFFIIITNYYYYSSILYLND